MLKSRPDTSTGRPDGNIYSVKYSVEKGKFNGKTRDEILECDVS